MADHPISLKCLDGTLSFDLQLTLCHKDDEVKVRIANYHTNVVHLERNGTVLLDIPVEMDEENGLTDRSLLTMRDIVDFAETVAISDVRELLDQQISLNMAIAREGLTKTYGANVGQVIWNQASKNDPLSKAKAAAAAASDARMGGCELPVIINSGSGNQGITSSVPVIVYAQEIQADQERLYRALVLSNLITIHQKTRIGRLSAYCGAVSAGASAGAGIAYLDGGGYEEIIHTVVNALAIVSGMVCDGAKASCAGKIAIAIDAGILGYRMFQQGQQFYGGDGIISRGIESTLENVGRLGKIGMRETDREILQIMLDQ